LKNEKRCTFAAESWQSGRLRRSCTEGIPLGKTVDLHGSGGSSKGIPEGESLTLRNNQEIPDLLMAYFTYILKSLSHGNYYYGSTANIEQRLVMHNKGKVRYTKGRRPWVLHYKEEFDTRSDAFRRERYFKSVEGNIYLKAQKII
jgi:putative endonuclease